MLPYAAAQENHQESQQENQPESQKESGADSHISSDIRNKIRTGRYDVSVNISDIVDPQSLGRFSSVYDASSDISWHIYVPPNYDPAHPPGVFVYISPSESGAGAGHWYKRFEAENLIYIIFPGAF